MNETLSLLEEHGIFPIVEIEEAASVRPLVEALEGAGLPVIEIAMRTTASLDAMRIVRDEYPNVLLGAGTVLSPDAAKKAHSAGARFMLSPGFNPRVVDFCLDNGYAFVPGVSTATHVEWAVERGLDTLKFFPAEASGGIRYLEAMANPFKNVRFIPTGGINNENVASYMGLRCTVACGGTWIAKPKLVSQKRFDEIEQAAGIAMDASMGFMLARIELPEGRADAGGLRVFKRLLSAPTLTKIEQCMDAKAAPPLLSESVHEESITIVIYTVSLKRAASYLRRKGLGFAYNEPGIGCGHVGELTIEPCDRNIRFKLIEKSLS